MIEETEGKSKQWQINKAVHYNAWADLQKGDFLLVVTAFRALTTHFSCPTCGEMLSITADAVARQACVVPVAT